MRVKKMRRLSLAESIDLTLLAARVEADDPTLADLVRQVVRGDDTALVGVVDRLKELGRDAEAESLKKAVLR